MILFLSVKISIYIKQLAKWQVVLQNAKKVAGKQQVKLAELEPTTTVFI